MKDRTRSSKKLLRAIGKKNQLGGTTWLTKNADTKLLRKMMRDQSLLLNEAERNLKGLFASREALAKLVEKYRKAERP